MCRSTRRALLIALGAAALGARGAFAQERAVRIGVLSNIDRELSATFSFVAKRLAALGYVEGKNAVFEYRNGGGNAESLSRQARELLKLNPDLVMTLGPVNPVRALIAEKAALPIVFIAIDYDPVDSGIVGSYNRPGGNFTGAYIAQPALAAKRLEIVRELAPAARRILVPYDTFCADQLAAVRAAALKLGLSIEAVEFKATPYDYAAAFRHAAQTGAKALVGLMSPQFFTDRVQIAELAAKARMPAVGGANQFAEAGFLASYGAPFARVGERAAEIAARILKGAKPADTPVEQVNVFEFAVNMKTAKVLGITFSNSILVRAETVFK